MNPGAFPEQPLLHLDALWIQVAGTRCNLACTHCFVSCSPAAERLAMLSRAEVRSRVAEALPLGVKEFYFTGGEPFLHPEMIPILEDTLPHGPCTVLTNGTLFTAHRLERLVELAAAARYSLELRVSLDGERAADHDAFRGPGSFERTLDGLRRCAAAGLLPIVTITRHEEDDPLGFGERVAAMLRAAGLPRPRLKVLPVFRLGREAARDRGYAPEETLAGLAEFDPARLQCGGCRAVSSAGVHVCPLLVDEPGGLMGARLDEATGPFTLSHGACLTCWVSGATCANA